MDYPPSGGTVVGGGVVPGLRAQAAVAYQSRAWRTAPNSEPIYPRMNGKKIM
jgi:hypothetical protein